MRALVYTAPNKVEVQQVPAPVPLANELLVSVQAAGICGSDMSGFMGHSARRKPPLILGHELVGRLPNGQRVVANPIFYCGVCERCVAGQQNLCVSWQLLGMDRTPGAFAEFVSVPARQLHQIPGDLPVERAILAEPLANVIHLFRIASAPIFSSLAIVGAGTMGSLCLLVGRRVGCRKILIVDVNRERLAIMSQLGAEVVAQTAASSDAALVNEMARHGYDMVIDASGSASARQMAFTLCRAGGLVCLLGLGSERSELEFATSIRKEHRTIMSFAYTPKDFQCSLELLLAGKIDLTPWTSSQALESGQQAFELMTQSPGATLKMILQL